MLPKLPKTEIQQMKLSDLNKPGDDLLKPLLPVRYDYILPADNDTLTHESVSYLAWLHPVIIHGPRNEVIGNIRIFHLFLALSGNNSEKLIPVRKIVGPGRYSRKEISQLACRDIVLSVASFTIRRPAPTLYASCHEYSTFSKEKDPIFANQSSRTMAKTFDVTVNTLRRLITESYCNE
jgi:hypothetical protein